MSHIFIYQIRYDPSQAKDPDLLTLDNSSNERPDWYEYWPIRNFLLNESLDDSSFYGFLSPKFKEKTNLTGAAAKEFVGSFERERTDVVLLSPSLHWTAYHLNVFKYGDAVHPGLLKVADRFFRQIGQPANLHALVTHSRNEVYSNYIIAKPRFWRTWLEITERLFEIAESPTDPLGVTLREPTRYRGKTSAQLKVFIIERIATWILVRDCTFAVRVRDPFVTRNRIYKLPGAIVCDALKIAYVTNKQEEYKDLFRLVSKFGKLLSWQIRIGAILGFQPILSCVASLSSYWTKTGKADK